MATVILTGVVTKGHLGRNKAENKYIPDGNLSVYEILKGSIPEQIDQENLPLVFRKPPRLLKKNTLLHLQGDFIFLGRKQALSVEDYNILTPSAVKAFLDKRGIDIHAKRKELARIDQFAVNDAIKEGRLLELDFVYNQDVQKIDAIFDKSGLNTDIELPYQITDFFEHRAKVRGFEAVSEMILHNPYVLAEVEGMDYLKADIVAKTLQWEHPQAFLIKLYTQLITAAWSYARDNGHSYIPINHAKVRMDTSLLAQLGGREKENFLLTQVSVEMQKYDFHAAAQIISSGSKEWNQEVGAYYSERYQGISEKINYYGKYAGTGFYLARAYFSERYAAEIFASHSRIDPWEEALELLPTITDSLDINQAQALNNAFSHTISVLVGPAGSGKTHVMAKLVHIIRGIGKKSMILAPSALAASIAGYKTGLEDIKYQTLHRFSRILSYADDLGTKEIAVSPHEKDMNEIDCIIIDEMSMCDIPTFYAFLHAIKNYPHIHIVLVGDIAQLPSIGPSGFFHQLTRGILADRVPVITLRGNYRSGNVLNDFAQGVRKGEFLLPQETDCVESIPASMQAITNLAENLHQSGYKHTDVLFLSTKKGNELGTQQLNIALRKIFLSDMLPIGKTIFYMGDPVISIKNDYAEQERSATIKRKRHPGRCQDVYNGTRGIILAYDEDSDSVTVQFQTISGDFTVPYRTEELISFLEPAYALTVHKAQGAEALHVIFTRSISSEKTTRNALYTAVTRAKEKIWLVGSDWQKSVENKLPDPYSKFAFRVKAIWGNENKRESLVANVPDSSSLLSFS